MLIFCHPQNPTGRAYTRAELEAVAAFAIRHDLIVVSDEIHADIVYPGSTHIPLASLRPEIAARTITITSATKSFNIPALRCAVMHFGHAASEAALLRAHSGALARLPWRHRRGCHGRGVGRRPALARRDHGAAASEPRLAGADALAAELPGVTMRVPEATYLAWLDCSALELPCPAGQFFLDHARVGLNFGETFGAQYANFARLNFATPAPVLQQIVGRMAEAIRQR